MEITLTPELERFVADEIADGAFPSSQDLVLALLKLYREKKLAVMRREIMIGVEQADRGETLPINEETMAELMAEIDRELDEEEASGHERAALQQAGPSRPESGGQKKRSPQPECCPTTTG